MIDLSCEFPPRYDLKNPARALIEDGAPDFGYTDPSYNGNSAVTVRSGVMQTLAPATVSAPTLQFWTPGDGHAYTHAARIQASAQHDFSWTVHLPPRPTARYWEHRVLRGDLLWALLDHFHIRRPGMFAGRTADWLTDPDRRRWFGLPGVWIIRITPQPSVRAFMDHILAHEFQHVEDHAWLANEIFGPLDNWHQQHQLAGTVFRAHERFNLSGVLVAGYAETSQRILRYWQQAIVDSGNLFHNTLQGDHPLMTITNIAHPQRIGEPGLIEIDVTPRHLLPWTGYDLDDPLTHPQRYSGGQFRLADGVLGGNEPHLTTIPVGGYRSRTIQYGDLVAGGLLVDDAPVDADTGWLYQS